MSDRPAIALEIHLDGSRADSETRCAWVEPYVLVVVTTVPHPDLAVEIYSTFVANAGAPTCATHLILGSLDYLPMITNSEDEHADLEAVDNARKCVYEHAQVVIEALSGFGREPRIGVPDDAFVELEQVER